MTDIPAAALSHAPAGTTITGTERMSDAFTKYHLSDGRALHHFTQGEPDAEPHDHPWSFETTILAGGYVEEVFWLTDDDGRGWASAFVNRPDETKHRLLAEHIHRIVSLPEGECWTLVRAGPVERETRFWRFGERVESRAHNEGWG